MNTQPASRTIDLPAARNPAFTDTIISAVSSTNPLRITTVQDKDAMWDALSFSVCFAVIAILTGALLFYRVGVTISGLTNILFYSSLAGMAIFAFRAIWLARQKPDMPDDRAGLN